MKETVLKFDLRSEIGVIAEMGKQAIPVLANECIVRSFYFIRRLALEIKNNEIQSYKEARLIQWDKLKPYNNPTITRMLTISTGVFTTLDVTEAIISQKYWVSVNYIGVGRFLVALETETVQFLKVRNVEKIRQMYEEIERNTFLYTDKKYMKG